MGHFQKKEETGEEKGQERTSLEERYTSKEGKGLSFIFQKSGRGPKGGFSLAIA